MSNEENDILDASDTDDSGFEDFDTGTGSLSDSVKTNPLFKIGIVIAAFAVIAGGIMLFGGKEVPLDMSSVQNPADVKQFAGAENVSPVYEEAVRDKNEQAVELAQRQGTSAMPVPIGAPKAMVPLTKPEAEAEDPLERWRRIQEERLRKEQLAAATTQMPMEAAAPVDPYLEQKSALASSFATQMQSVLDGLKLGSMKTVSITGPEFMESKRSEEEQARKELEESMEAASEEEEAALAEVEVLIEPGAIEYAQLITEANTDAPGPVLAVLASGPLAGSRLIGSFAANDELVTLSFNTIVVDGVAVPTSAIALDPATSKPGVITEVDHKYFKRVILPAAASFIEGIGGAIAESGATTVSAGAGTTTSSQNDLNTRQEFFKGIEEASGKVSEILDQDAGSVKPMLRVAAGTRLGLLFSEPVERTIEAASGKKQSLVSAAPNQIQTSGTPTGR